MQTDQTDSTGAGTAARAGTRGAAPERRALVFNTSFFDLSQTFIHEQVQMLAGLCRTDLLAYKFMNPHGYDMSGYKTVLVSRYDGWRSRLLQRTIRRNLFDRVSARTITRLFRENDYAVVHAHFGTNALDLLPFARRAGVPLVVSFHGADASRSLRHSGYRKRLPALFDYAAAIVISSPHMADTLGLEPWSSKVHLVPYAVDTDRVKPEPMENVSGNKAASGSGEPAVQGQNVSLLHSGRIVGKKGVPDLVRVFLKLAPLHPELELQIAGDGEERAECEALLDGSPWRDRVVFHGGVSHSRVLDLLNRCDIFVLNSRTGDDGDMEGTPVSMLEALAMGRPVVSTRHAGIPMVIRDGENGLLADERDNDGLERCIARLLTEPGLRRTLGEAARRTIVEGYSRGVIRAKLQQVFEGAMQVHQKG